MKRIIISLCLILSFLLCGCSKEEAPSGTVEAEIADEAAQTTQTVVAENVEEFVEKPFAEEMGLNFVSPGAYSVPVTLFSKSPTLDLAFSNSDCLWSAPEISCEADGEEHLIYTISYVGKFDQEIHCVKSKTEGNIRWGSVISGYDVFDYYTGMEFQPDVGEVINTGSSDNQRIYTVEYDDNISEITCTKTESQEVSFTSHSNGDSITYSSSPLLTFTVIVRTPRDYDGLVLGISPTYKHPVPEDPFAEDVIDDQIHYFGDEEYETPENYEFIRIADYVDIPAASVSTSEQTAQ